MQEILHAATIQALWDMNCRTQKHLPVGAWITLNTITAIQTARPHILGTFLVTTDTIYSKGETSRYTAMRDALNASGRPIFFNMCEWGYDLPALWGR